MLSDVWFYLFWVAVALCASTGAALFVVLHPATDPADTGNQQREYTSPIMRAPPVLPSANTLTPKY